MKLSLTLMRALRNTPIKRKLMLITMLTSGVAMMIACAAFLTYDLLSLRDTMGRNLSTTAAIIGENSTAALSFNDPDSARQTLDSLHTLPHIVAAAIYDKHGKVFAQYQSSKSSESFTAPVIEADGMRSDIDSINVFRRIDLAGERIGTLYLRSDQEEVQARVNGYALIFVLTMLAASGAAYLLSNTLQAIISSPVSHLAQVVQRVTSEKNYSVRAVKQSEDELGHLIDGFNEMLNQIQQRDYALQEARNDLERRVEQRTQELANSLSLLNGTFESSPDGIISFQFAGGVTFYNSQYLKMWNMPTELLGPEPGNEPQRLAVVAGQLKDPQRFLTRQQQIRDNRETNVFDVHEFKDGRTIERYIKPQHVDGVTVGVVITFRDITERKRAEHELETIHRKLLDASRQAGMAEVASNVLHNVGNVLNSVNVSANLVTENMKRSKVTALAKVAALLHDHGHDLAAFITEDPKGKLLPGFLQQLCEHLRSEQQGTVKELESLRNNIDHIKEIVAMQQNYSKVSGVKEIVNVVDLIEDTLHMSEGALQRHGVSVVREFEAVPMINTEKHKILQILVNLVRNAKYACSECANPDKRIMLRVTSDAERIKIAVTDTGVGISADNMTRIFGHGFTTRKDGHGFGLHSGALAAKELGGVLHVHSDGVGLGATFTLELPKDVVPEAQCLPA